jgi:hypothetical protein
MRDKICIPNFCQKGFERSVERIILKQILEKGVVKARRYLD